MIIFLKLLSGICWSIVYIESIRKGFKDKTYAMPLFALGLNIAWEGLYTWVDLSQTTIEIQAWVNLVWFLLDIVIVYTFYKFGKDDFSKYTGKKLFIPAALLIFAMSFIIQYGFFMEFGHSLGASYSAFLQNLLMSILYINMLANRKSLKGQSQTIAISKWIGTLAPTILFGMIYGNTLILILGLFCSVFDIAYILYLNHYKKQLEAV
jgi:hypothetical protein